MGRSPRLSGRGYSGGPRDPVHEVSGGVSRGRLASSASISSTVHDFRGSAGFEGRGGVADLRDTIDPMISPSFDLVTRDSLDFSNFSRQRSYESFDPARTTSRNSGSPIAHLNHGRNINFRDAPGGNESSGAGLFTSKPTSTNCRKYRVICRVETPRRGDKCRRSSQNGLPLSDAIRPYRRAALPFVPARKAASTATAPRCPAGPKNNAPTVTNRPPSNYFRKFGATSAGSIERASNRPRTCLERCHTVCL